MFTWPGEPTRNEPGKGRLKGQQRLPDDNCSGPEVGSPRFRTVSSSACGAQHRKYSRRLISVGRITTDEPPDVWAVFLCITRKGLRGNFCYQAISLIDPATGGFECNRDFAPTILLRPR